MAAETGNAGHGIISDQLEKNNVFLARNSRRPTMRNL